MPPFVIVAVKVTFVPEQILVEVALTLTVGVRLANVVIVWAVLSKHPKLLVVINCTTNDPALV